MQTSVTRPTFAVHVHDLTYRQIEGRDLKALLYVPEGEGPFPALLCLHGGAWISGDRSATAYLAEALAATGIVVMAIDFRMAPLNRYPDSLVDVNYAIRWLKIHAKDYSVDPARIGGLGISSGGHLILLAALRPYDARYASAGIENEAPNAELGFVITCSGVLDPLARYHMAQTAGYAEILACHRAFFGDEETMAEASPPLIIERGEVVSLPPLLMIQGAADPRLPADTAERTASIYRSAGGAAEACSYPAMGHALSEWGSAERTDVLNRITAFVAQQNSAT